MPETDSICSPAGHWTGWSGLPGGDVGTSAGRDARATEDQNLSMSVGLRGSPICNLH